jgi:YegS/Rv2252/BmrU family lipid kinase
MRASVVVNPLAGGRRGAGFDPGATRTLVSRLAADAGLTADVRISDRAGGVRLCVEAAVQAGADLVVAWGGDGTVNEAASVLAGSGVALGIVPAGSGNGLARELRIPRAPARALQIAFAGRVAPIDAGLVGDRLFVNVAGFGFDARIARRFNASGAARGFLRYVRWTVAEAFAYEPRHYAVTWDDGRFDGTALFIVFANSRQFGNGARIAPEARLDDGRLELVVVRPTSPVRDLWRARRLFTGTLSRDPGVVRASLAAAAVGSGEGLEGHVDGESLDEAAGVQVRVWPGALRVCGGPSSQSENPSPVRPPV